MRAASLVLLLTALLCSPAAAEEVEAEVEVGYEGFAVEGGWTPIRVTLELPAGAPALSGRVVLRGEQLTRPAAYAAAFDLSPSAAQRLQLLVPTTLLGGRPVIIEDLQGRAIQELKLPTLTTVNGIKDPLVLVVGEGAGLTALRAWTGARNNGPRVAQLAFAELPEVAWAYDNVGMVVLADLPAAVPPAALNALQRYVECGGVLVTVGDRRPFWRSPELLPLLPARPAEERVEADEAALRELGFEAESLTLRRLPQPAGTSRRPITSRTPLWVSAPMGAGSLVMLAFDPDAPEPRLAPRLGDLLGELVELGNHSSGLGVPHRSALGTTFRAETQRLFEEQEIVGAPTLLASLLLIGLYLTAVSRGLPWLQRKRRWPLLVLVPPAGLGFAFILWILGAFLGPQTSARVLSAEVLLGPEIEGQRLSRQVVDLGVTAGAEVRLEVRSSAEYFPALRSMRGLEALLSPFSPTYLELRGPQLDFAPVSLHASGFTSLRLERPSFQPSPLLAVQRSDGRLALENLGGQPIGPIAILLRGAGRNDLVVVPELPPGGSEVIEGGVSFEVQLELGREVEGFWSLPAEDQANRWLLEALAGVRDYRAVEISTTTRRPDEVSWVAYARPQAVPLEVEIMGSGAQLPVIPGGHVVVQPAEEGP